MRVINATTEPGWQSMWGLSRGALSIHSLKIDMPSILCNCNVATAHAEPMIAHDSPTPLWLPCPVPCPLYMWSDLPAGGVALIVILTQPLGL
jgi:hypothetical protein